MQLQEPERHCKEPQSRRTEELSLSIKRGSTLEIGCMGVKLIVQRQGNNEMTVGHWARPLGVDPSFLVLYKTTCRLTLAIMSLSWSWVSVSRKC